MHAHTSPEESSKLWQSLTFVCRHKSCCTALSHIFLSATDPLAWAQPMHRHQNGDSTENNKPQKGHQGKRLIKEKVWQPTQVGWESCCAFNSISSLGHKADSGAAHLHSNPTHLLEKKKANVGLLTIAICCKSLQDLPGSILPSIYLSGIKEPFALFNSFFGYKIKTLPFGERAGSQNLEQRTDHSHMRCKTSLGNIYDLIQTCSKIVANICLNFISLSGKRISAPKFDQHSGRETATETRISSGYDT